jgi:chromosome partitioning protein
MIISFAGLKGGCGKTTLALCTATELAKRDQKVLIIDADPQATLSEWRELAGESSPVTLLAMPRPYIHNPGQLDVLAKNFDHVVIDCPASLGDITRSALMASDVVMLPLGPSPADYWTAVEAVGFVRGTQMVNRDLKGALVITRKIPGTKQGKNARNKLSEIDFEILNQEVTMRVDYSACMEVGKGVSQYSPKSAAAVEVRNLVDEIIKRSESETFLLKSEQVVSSQISA